MISRTAGGWGRADVAPAAVIGRAGVVGNKLWIIGALLFLGALVLTVFLLPAVAIPLLGGDLGSRAVVLLATFGAIAGLVAFVGRAGNRQPRSNGARARGHGPRHSFGVGRESRSTKDPRGPSPVRFDVDELARRLGVEADELRAARPAYARFTIPKRSGGTREIVAPDPATKALQRRILHRMLARLPVHPACHGFERDRSIVSNALPHAGRPVVVRLDVKEFFRSTSARRVRRFFRVLGWNREAAAILTRLTTLDGGLPQGAPTSPRLANLVNIQLDARLEGLAHAFQATYTRYADDLTFSFEDEGHGLVGPVIRATRRFLRQTGYEMHEGRKLRIRRRHQRQLVTGLVVNSRVALPRSRRRWLRAVEHHIRTGRPATLTEAQLKGWHAYELMIERSAMPTAGSEGS